MTLPLLTHPDWFVPLGLLLVAAVLSVSASRFWGHRRSRRLLGRSARTELRAARRRSLATDGCLVAALCAIAVALLGPRLAERTVELASSNIDVVLLLDLSQSMQARDVPPNRLTRAKLAAARLLAQLQPGDRAALAAYGGHGVLLTPLTPDSQALAELLAVLDSEVLREGGSNLPDGIRAALEAFDTGEDRARRIVAFGDGEVSHPGLESAAAALSRAGVQLIAAAFGSEAGATVPNHGAPLADASGRIVTSRRRLESFQQLARATSGRVLEADEWGEVDLAGLMDSIASTRVPNGEHGVKVTLRASAYPPFAALAFVALCGEALFRRTRRRRSRASLRFFGRHARKPRRVAAGLLAMLSAMSLLGADLPAKRSSRAELQRAAEWIEEGVAYAEVREWDKASWAFLAAALESDDAPLGGLAYHNFASVALARGELEAARDGFFESLALRPGNRKTQYDLEWTLRRLAAAEPPPASSSATSQPPDEPEETDPVREQSDRAEESPAAITPRNREPDERRSGGVANGSAVPAKPNPTQPPLSEEERRRWLSRVEDDSASALRLSLRSQQGQRDTRRRSAVAW